MIDATPSLVAAEGLTGAVFAEYLAARGWDSRPSRARGVLFLTKPLTGTSDVVELILPTGAGEEDETRRIADALRTVAAMERRDVFAVAEDVRRYGSASSVPTAIRGFAEE